MTISTEMYAKALFESSSQDPLVFLADLETFGELLKADKKINDYFTQTYDSFVLVKDLLSEKFSHTFVNFLEIIYENRVFQDLDNIKSNYQELLVEHDLLTVVRVVSAKELSEDHKEEIIKMVKSKYPAAMKISYEIDENLIFGYVIKVNKDIYDTSVKSKLEQIRQLEVG